MNIWSTAVVRIALFAGACAASQLFDHQARPVSTAQAAQGDQGCASSSNGITLPKGFCATVFADNIGHVRQMAVGPNGTLYVNTWSGVYFKQNTPPDGGYAVALKDNDGDGRAEVMQRFGEGPTQGGHGGTGVAVYHEWVYIETNDRIMRYKLKASDVAPSGSGEPIVSGLPVTGDHPMHPFWITAGGALLIDLGSATNACEKENRTPHSRGNQPCVEKETRGGIWRYDANAIGQRFSAKERYASGIRNGEGIAADSQGRLFSTQHGRDQLHEDWPELYSAKQGQESPAEEIVALKQGADYGWPECYYDMEKKGLTLAPEFGGDAKEAGLCGSRTEPVAVFPGHWAPDDMKFYLANGPHAFPHAYFDGAFIAFHGSWNRAPGPQGGYNVVFQPFKNGRPSGHYVVFADGFAGAVKEPGSAAFRPAGLAVARDGALFISDDVHGRIWRVTYVGGNADASVEAAPEAASSKSASAEVLPPEGIHPDASRQTSPLSVPLGSSADQIALGDRIFHSSSCVGCHGSDGKGSALGADLTSGKWLWSDGSVDGIQQTVKNGVEHPKEHNGVMPPMGGASLSPADLRAVSAYVWALGRSQR
ncbi:c-type cytochrome [Paraburkholderia sp. 22B1P]|uniref:c-type cytochrome n=1 Tax=Paraburkholderia sp. 22B1P TaxID=3080498 RepID=UPI0030918867|nr:c-type cytochrome [Paraburkholderia sp. 22B1P]